MQIFRSRAASAFASLAALSVTATPVLAHGRDDWHRHRHYRGGGISGGDLLAGLLVVGGVAAIATAVSKDNADKRQDTPEPYRYPGGSQSNEEADYGAPVRGDDAMPAYPGGPLPGRDDAADAGREGSLGEAVDACEAELERADKRVDAVSSVQRMGARVSVEGRLQDGRPFACSVDDTGHIRSVAVDGHGMI